MAQPSSCIYVMLAIAIVSLQSENYKESSYNAPADLNLGVYIAIAV